MTRYYIQVGVITHEGYDEADTYEEILAMALKYREIEQAKHGHLGQMYFDIEKIGENDEV